MRFEHRHDKLLPPRKFAARMARAAALAAWVLLVALLVGVAGYRGLAHLGWTDSILEASMILAGMGPVTTLSTRSAKLFASGYAIFSGVVFLTSIGVLFAPAMHRLLHAFHVDEKDLKG
jgi:hypothetical protein